jgi:uncharacterized membrane protein (GlpM family)
MSELFLLKLLLSFLVGGLFVSACTVAAERFGTNVGGIIGGFPSTIAVTLLFIGVTSSPEALTDVTDVVPLVVGFNGLFLVSFAILARRGLFRGLGGGLLVWFVLSFGAVLSGFRSFPASVLTFAALLAFAYYLLQHRLKLPVHGESRVRPSAGQIAGRAAFSGSIIALAVYLNRTAGPVVGGLFAVFPAAFVSTLVIASRARGVEFARTLTKPMMISGMINVVVYGICVRYFYPTMGLTLGTAGALAISLVTAFGTYRFVDSRTAMADGESEVAG